MSGLDAYHQGRAAEARVAALVRAGRLADAKDVLVRELGYLDGCAWREVEHIRRVMRDATERREAA